MTEIVAPMRAVEVDMACECAVGRMRPNGMLLVLPPKYVHACTKCGKTSAYDVSYPYIRYEPWSEQ